MKLPRRLQEFVDLIMAFWYCQKGGLTAKGAASMAVAFLVAAITMPIGLNEIYTANTTLWDTAVITVFTILFPILFVIAVCLKAVS